MKKIEYIVLLLIWGITFTACEDNKEEIPATEITNIISSTGENSIMLEWEYEEDENTNRYIEIRYYDPVLEKEVSKSVYGASTYVQIDEISSETVEYIFHIQPFSVTFTAGTSQTISVVVEKKPVIDEPEYEIVGTLGLTGENDATIKSEDGMLSISNPTTMPMTYLFDKNPKTNIYADWNSPLGTVFNIDIKLPKEQQCLKFYYQNEAETWNSANSNYPKKIECYIKKSAADDWELLQTLTQDFDFLPYNAGEEYTSDIYKAAYPFNEVRLKVTETIKHNNNPSTAGGFGMAELMVYDVQVKE